MHSSETTVSDERGVYIQPSRRPDGSLRKAIRVKAGYVPQDEVPLYESKGKQFASRTAAQILPVGLDPSHVKPKVDPKNPIPGLVIMDAVDKKKKKKKKPSDSSSTTSSSNVLPNNNLAKNTKSQNEFSKGKKATQQQYSDNVTPEELEKRIKNLKKKIREIKTLEQKIESGEIKAPEKDQKDKILRKPELLSEIMALKLSLYGESVGEHD